MGGANILRPVVSTTFVEQLRSRTIAGMVYGKSFHTFEATLKRKSPTTATSSKKQQQHQSTSLKKKNLATVTSNPPLKPLKLRPPIPPSASNITVKDDHPLWQFFDSKKYMRTTEDLKNIGEPWSIPQLRRKSFDELHTLWYVCLKERNRLLRESRIYQTWNDQQLPDDPFVTTSESIKTTMWRIRHVLSERNHGWLNGLKELRNSYKEILGEFEEDYLTADSSADREMGARLERFQYALFGINPMLEDNVPEPKICKGLKVVARLKLTRFAGGNMVETAEQDNVVVDSIRDINEAFILFTAEHSPEGVEDAINTIHEYRSQNLTPVSVSEELEVLARLMFNFEREGKGLEGSDNAAVTAA